MQKFDLKFKAMGSHALLIEWPDKIDENILDDIIRFTKVIVDYEGEYLLNYTPAYNSILLQYSLNIDLLRKQELLKKIYNSNSSTSKSIPQMWDIPVCYDATLGIDLPLFAAIGLSANEVIQLHSSIKYRVYMIGFLPGFLYLGNLPAKLYMERKINPRSVVPKGSIAIGGKQTGIYPIDSPGGWQIIGRTPLSIFDLKRQVPCQIKQGDYVQFHSITLEEYYETLSS